MFNVENLEISGAKLIELPKSKDKRGWFVKIFNDQNFIQMNTPGVTHADVTKLTYQKRRAPLFPFETE
jgi:dTDP-4-dehydrorhamnose 3,5-epimerase-like enzyme